MNSPRIILLIFVAVLALSGAWFLISGSPSQEHNQTAAEEAAEEWDWQTAPRIGAVLLEEEGGALARESIFTTLHIVFDFPGEPHQSKALFDMTLWQEGGLQPVAHSFFAESDSSTSFQVPSGGRYTLHASSSSWICAPLSFELNYSNQDKDITMEAHHGITWSGRVMDEDRQGIAGAVILGLTSQNTYDTGVRTDVTGGFQLRLLASDFNAAYGVMALERGFAPATAMFEKSVQDELEIVMQRGWTVQGKVTAANDGAPLAGAKLSWHNASVDRAMQEELREKYRTATTDDEGRFTLSGVSPGTSMVRVECDGYVRAQAELTAANKDQQLLFQLETGTTLVGRVKDTQGIGIEHAQLEISLASANSSASKRWAVTNAEGHFQFRDQMPGDYLLEVGARGFTPVGIELTLPHEAELLVELQKASTLRGTVIAANSDALQYSVMLLDASEKRVHSGFFTTSDFQLDSAPAGEFRVQLSTEDGAAIELGVVTIPPAASVDLGQVSLEAAGGMVMGRVVVFDTLQPLPALVFLSAKSGKDKGKAARQIRADSEGKFHFSGLEAGKYSLSAMASGEYTSSKSVSFVSDGASVMQVEDIGCPQAGAVEVQILGSQGEALAGVKLGFQCGSSVRTGATTDANGVYYLDGLQIAVCKVSPTIDGKRYTLQGKVRPGETLKLVLDLRTYILRSWKAKVLTASGEPVVGAHVWASGKESAWSTALAETDANGNFELHGDLLGLAAVAVSGMHHDTDVRFVQVVDFGASGSGPDSITLPGATISGVFPAGATSLRLKYLDWNKESYSGISGMGTARGFAFLKAGSDFEFHFLVPGDYRLLWLDEENLEIGETMISGLQAGESRTVLGD